MMFYVVNYRKTARFKRTSTATYESQQQDFIDKEIVTKFKFFLC